ncbi:MAG: MaoC family dehydratase N-terminal domain-containing protein [Chloroflexi bacterium]|nr:MaoC family dehydratase N-terminal domain-containing protein [Chloroflexota bacterium]
MLYFEDFELNQTFDTGSYIVDKDEAIEFAKKWDPQIYHIDEEAAKKSIYGGLTVPSSYMIAVSDLLNTSYFPEAAVIAALGRQDMEFPNPARPGDRLTCLNQTIERRESKTKPDRGILRNRIELKNQNDEIVLSYVVTTMISKRLV